MLELPGRGLAIAAGANMMAARQCSGLGVRMRMCVLVSIRSIGGCE